MKFQDSFLFDIIDFHNFILRAEKYLTISTSVMGIFDIQGSQIFCILNQMGRGRLLLIQFSQNT